MNRPTHAAETDLILMTSRLHDLALQPLTGLTAREIINLARAIEDAARTAT